MCIEIFPFLFFYSFLCMISRWQYDCNCSCKDNWLKVCSFLLCVRVVTCCRATHDLPAYGPPCTVGVLARTHWGATESRMTLWQSVNPLLWWLESWCSVIVVFVGVVVVQLRILTSARLEALLELSVVFSVISVRSIRNTSSWHGRIAPKFLRIVGALFDEILSNQILIDVHFRLFKISSYLYCLLSALSRSILFTSMAICFTSRRLTNFDYSVSETLVVECSSKSSASPNQRPATHDCTELCFARTETDRCRFVYFCPRIFSSCIEWESMLCV